MWRAQRSDQRPDQRPDHSPEPTDRRFAGGGGGGEGRIRFTLICELHTEVISLSKLDPRAPLVLDTRELGRRPGSQRKESPTVPAPADLGIEVLRVPEGSPVDLDLRLEAVMEGVLVTGTARAALDGGGARGLEPISDEIEARFQELFVYDEHQTSHDEDDEVSTLEGDLV